MPVLCFVRLIVARSPDRDARDDLASCRNRHTDRRFVLDTIAFPPVKTRPLPEFALRPICGPIAAPDQAVREIRDRNPWNVVALRQSLRQGPHKPDKTRFAETRHADA